MFHLQQRQCYVGIPLFETQFFYQTISNSELQYKTVVKSIKLRKYIFMPALTLDALRAWVSVQQLFTLSSNKTIPNQHDI